MFLVKFNFRDREVHSMTRESISGNRSQERYNQLTCFASYTDTVFLIHPLLSQVTEIEDVLLQLPCIGRFSILRTSKSVILLNSWASGWCTCTRIVAAKYELDNQIRYIYTKQKKIPQIIKVMWINTLFFFVCGEIKVGTVSTQPESFRSTNGKLRD